MKIKNISLSDFKPSRIGVEAMIGSNRVDDFVCIERMSNYVETGGVYQLGFTVQFRIVKCLKSRYIHRVM